MRSFFIALCFLLMVSYWAHVFVTNEFDPNNNFVPIIVNNQDLNHGICECRCCILSGTMCETTIRYSLSFRKNFSCHLCTDNFCTMNTNEAQQCQWMYTMKADCYQYKSHEKISTTFMNLRPILQ